MHLSKPLLKLKPCLLRASSILAIFSLLFLASCKQVNQPKETPKISESQQQTLNKSEISGKYSVKSLNGNTENLGNLIFDFDSENKKLGVTTDCNTIGAGYQITGTNISFTNAMSTRKFCQGAMDNENSVSKSLSKIAKFRFSEKELKLLSEDNQVLVNLIKTDKSE